MMIGVLNINKESGMSSAAVVSKMRRILGTKQVGHFGTLDPQGTGVLLIGVGKATRLMEYFLRKDKEYEADFAFGYETDTLDGDGEVVAKAEKIPTEEELRKAIKNFVGELDQIPPQYSAKSVGGVRAYDIARKGGSVLLKSSRVRVDSFKLLRKVSDNVWRFKIACSSGTYIRSLCRDLAASVGSKATMTSIDRTRAGDFLVSEAVTIGELEKLGVKALIPVEKALEKLPKKVFKDSLYEKIAQGIKIEVEKTEQPFLVYCKTELFGIGIEEGGRLRIPTYLRG